MDKEKLKLDRMRYVTDSIPSMLAILAIVFNVLYFCLIYKINNPYFYNFKIGLSVIVNLLFMLLGFWCSIEVKNYHGKFGYVMIALGVIQLIRILVYPVGAHGAKVLVGEEMMIVMTDSQFIIAVVLLVAAAALMILGGLLSIKNSKTLMTYLNSLEKK